MMRLARRATLLVAFYLLTSAATAYAECAWELWVKGAVRGKVIANDPWESFQSLAECRKAMYGDDMKKIVADGKRQGSTYVPVCLPDTVDPRGPKAK